MVRAFGMAPRRLRTRLILSLRDIHSNVSSSHRAMHNIDLVRVGISAGGRLGGPCGKSTRFSVEIHDQLATVPRERKEVEEHVGQGDCNTTHRDAHAEARR